MGGCVVMFVKGGMWVLFDWGGGNDLGCIILGFVWVIFYFFFVFFGILK